MIVARRLRHIADHSVHLGSQVVIRYRPLTAFYLTKKLGAIFDLEQVKRQVLRLERQSVAEVGFPICECLLGKTRDQIQTDVLEACFSKQIDRVSRVIRSVRTTQRHELAVEERLNADAGTSLGMTGVWVH